MNAQPSFIAMLSVEALTWLGSAIERYANDDRNPQPLRDAARYRGVLPLVIDWTGFWALHTSGTVLVFDTEYGAAPAVEGNPRLVRMALFQASHTHPWLTAVVPAREPSDVDCPHCEGTGLIAIDGVRPDAIICHCGGLGWLNEHEVPTSRA